MSVYDLDAGQLKKVLVFILAIARAKSVLPVPAHMMIYKVMK